jgi:hypothetical protein
MTDVATIPVAPAPEAPKEKKLRGRNSYQTVFKSVEEAQAEATKRTSGPTRVWKAHVNGKDIVTLANHFDHACGNVFLHLGMVCEEIGGRIRQPKQLSPDAVMAAVNAMPESEREAVLAQLKALLGAKKK